MADARLASDLMRLWDRIDAAEKEKEKLISKTQLCLEMLSQNQNVSASELADSIGGVLADAIKEARDNCALDARLREQFSCRTDVNVKAACEANFSRCTLFQTFLQMVGKSPWRLLLRLQG